MKDIYAEILTSLARGKGTLLATIISSSGSTPLPAGAKILVAPPGEGVAGTVGGGLLEATVIAEGREILAGGRASQIRQYELDSEDTEGGMICGGSVDVLYEVLAPTEDPPFRRLCERRATGDASILLRLLDSAKNVVERHVTRAEGSAASTDTELALLLKRMGMSSERFLQHLDLAVRTENVKRAEAPGGDVIIELVPGVQQLVIFGGGHVARSVSSVASTAGFAVTVVDDRPEFANPERFPEARQTLAVPFQEAFQKITIGRSSSIVIMTRGHAMDRHILELALRTPARYIGMIGSAKKVASTFTALRAAGFPLELLRRVHAPIGLDIGAVMAEEIAVSIVAELIRTRRGVDAPPLPMSSKMRYWFSGEAMTGKE